MTDILVAGLRAVYFDRNPGVAACCFGNWTRLHIHDYETAATGDCKGGQGTDSGEARAYPSVLDIV